MTVVIVVIVIIVVIVNYAVDVIGVSVVKKWVE